MDDHLADVPLPGDVALTTGQLTAEAQGTGVVLELRLDGDGSDRP